MGAVHPAPGNGRQITEHPVFVAQAPLYLPPLSGILSFVREAPTSVRCVLGAVQPKI